MPKPHRHHIECVRRALTKTHENVIITRDGFEFDSIVYQAAEIGHVLDANYAKTGFKDRVTGTSKVRLSIRTFEGNLHRALVYDEARQRYVQVFSTCPSYSQNLSRWEHNEYRRVLHVEKPGKIRELNRLRERKGKLLHRIHALPRESVRAAGRSAALMECQEVRRATGARAHRDSTQAPGLRGMLAISGESLRSDVPKSVFVPRGANKPKPPPPPERLLTSLGVKSPESINIIDGCSGAEDTGAEFTWPDLADDE